MNELYIPPTIKCFWCKGKMELGGSILADNSYNEVSYFCCDCGGIAHFSYYNKTNKYKV